MSLIGRSKMELTDVNFSFKEFHRLFENIETDLGDCLTSFVYFKEMNTFFYMNRRIRKPTICICKNKGADQLCK